MTTDITELTSVQKNANIHRLSRLIAYAPNDELRQLAVEVEQYTEQLIEALEHYKSREERVISLVRDNSKSWDELYRQIEAKGKRNAELVEALEKAQQRIVELQQCCENDPRIHEIIDLKERIDNLESFRTAYMEWGEKTDWVQTDKRFDVLKPWGKHRADVLKEYIQHLESRTVTVKLPQRLQPGADGWDDWYVHSDDEGEYLKFDDVLAMLTAAGIKVEAE